MLFGVTRKNIPKSRIFIQKKDKNAYLQGVFSCKIIQIKEIFITLPTN